MGRNGLVRKHKRTNKGEIGLKKGKAIKTAMAMALGLSTFALGAFSPAQKVAAETALKEVTAPTLGVTADLGMANDERLIEMLKKQGKISKNATQAQADKALQEYLKGKNKVGSAPWPWSAPRSGCSPPAVIRAARHCCSPASAWVLRCRHS